MTPGEKAVAEELLSTVAEDLLEDFREMPLISQSLGNGQSSLLEVQSESSRRRWFRRRSGWASIITDVEVGETIVDIFTDATDTIVTPTDTIVMPTETPSTGPV